MPHLDRTGPFGEKAMTGKKLGKCNPVNKGKTDEEIVQARISTLRNERFMGLDQGFGRGRSRGNGRGLGRRLGRGLGRFGNTDNRQS